MFISDSVILFPVDNDQKDTLCRETAQEWEINTIAPWLKNRGILMDTETILVVTRGRKGMGVGEMGEVG